MPLRYANSLTNNNRSNQGSQSHGIVIAENSIEDRQLCQSRQGPHPAHHHERPESLSLSLSGQPKAATKLGERFRRLELVAPVGNIKLIRVEDQVYKGTKCCIE
jgi:hypothetical protein